MENESQTPTRERANADQILQFLTTEHFTLQTARAATATDANARASIFLGSVASGIVALAFIGQITNVGAAFYLFALVLFPSLFFLGVVTFVRALQNAMEDMIHARGISRIRHYYAEIAPDIREYFMHSIYDDSTAVLRDMAISRSWFQPFVTTAGSVLVVNSILVGAWFSLAAQYFFESSLWLTVIIGTIIFVAALVAQHVYQQRRWAEFESHLPAKFPRAEGNLRT